MIVWSLTIVLSLLRFLSIRGFAGWIDPDTHQKHYNVDSYTDGNTYDLIMSDEFERSGRSFADGHDPMWTALDKSDDDQTASGRKSLQYYNSSYATTEEGKLVITTTTEDTTWRGFNPYTKKYEQLKKTFRSGMMQSWNKFCFTGSTATHFNFNRITLNNNATVFNI